MANQADPRTVFEQRRESRRASVELQERRHRALGNARLLVFGAAAALAWLALGRALLSLWWLAVPAAAFIALAVVHERILRSRDSCLRAVRYYDRSLARLDDRWAGTGETGARFDDPAHPYAGDLDLFGEGSLFQLLCAARTPMGEEVLARWLLSPASPALVRERQEAVAELRERLDLREALAVVGEDARSGVHPAMLAAWGEQPPALRSRALRYTAVALTGVGLLGLGLWIATGHPTYVLLAYVVDAWFLYHTRREVNQVVHAVEAAGHDLEVLAAVLAVFEEERFASPLLAGMRAALEVDGHPPSQRMARLRRLLELLDSRDHLLMRLAGPLLLWTVHLAFATEDWRARSGPAVRRWLVAVAEMEALCSLAGYAYEHPADPFPELAEGEPCLAGDGLTHPLLPAARAVRNDVHLGREPAVLVVSGSNMSGKSTLLRTVGVNTVLALAGAPVRAARLRLSPLQPGASIRNVDSLQGGTSRFYAEIRRLRAIVDLTAGPVPVLFLLDEFLHGTNSHDRRLGAQAIVAGLARRGALGLITTHDLALAEIADALGPAGANVHFEDRLEEGKLLFDYQLRPGVVRKSNALELMRSVGLDV